MAAALRPAAWLGVAAIAVLVAAAGLAAWWLADERDEQPAPDPAVVPPAGDGPLAGARLRLAVVDRPLDRLLGELAAGELAAAGARVELDDRHRGVGSAHRALRDGDAEVAWLHAAEVWLQVHHEPRPVPQPRWQHDRVAERDARDGLRWLEPAGYDDGWALLASADLADRLDAPVVSALAAELRTGARDPVGVCVAEEVADRPDALEGLRAHHGLDAADLPARRPPAGVEPAEAVVRRLPDDEPCELAWGRAVSGWLLDDAAVVLADDAAFLAVHRPAPVVADATAEQHEAALVEPLERAAEGLGGREAVAALAAIERGGVPPRAVAVELRAPQADR